MASRHRHPTRLPCAALEVLAETAERRLDAELAGRGRERGAHLVRIRLDGDGVELGARPLDGDDHPVDVLAGFRAPDDWWAIGVATTAAARHLDDPDAPPLRGRVVHLVARDGRWAARWAPAGGAPAVSSGRATDPSLPAGMVDDACRRALGLATAPPPDTTAALWLVQWLDAVATAAMQGRVRRWADAARLHPAVGALVADRTGDPPTPDALASKSHQLATWRDWPVLRRAAAAGTWQAPDMTPDVAAWLDDGAFARWVLGAYPDLPDLVGAVVALVSRPVLDAIEATIVAGADQQ